MTTLILIGGKSRRMGRDKAAITRPDGTRQLDHLLHLAREVSPALIVSTNEPLPDLPQDVAIMPDAIPGEGPLGALATLAARQPGSTLVIGGDLFLLDLPTLRHLVAHHDPTRPATCFANRIDGRPEPLCAIYSAAALSAAATALAAGERCARHFLESLDPLVLPLPHPAALDNANTPDELAECFAKLQHGVTPKTVNVLYFAKLREARGLDEERIETLACSPAGLYAELRFRHRLPLDIASLRAARNGDFCAWDEPLAEGDEIVFIPPVAGG
jgi:molybdopterin-guanine dinucleotide biosynthesis protein A